MRGETVVGSVVRLSRLFQSAPLSRGETRFAPARRPASSISIRSPLTRGDHGAHRAELILAISIHSPHTRGDAPSARPAPPRRHFNPLPSYEGRQRRAPHSRASTGISIHSPHTRGDSISLQKSIRIYVSLHNKTMIHRFLGLYKPLFAAQSPIFGVRSP